MRRSVLVGLTLAVMLGFVPGAFAQDEANWSVGAGFGTPTFLEGMNDLFADLGAHGAMLMMNRRPEMQFLVERRLTPTAYLLFQLSGGYTSTKQDVGDETISINATVLNATVGGRFVLNPGGVVEVSPFVLGAFTYGKGTKKDFEYDFENDRLALIEESGATTTLGLGAGVAFDRKLLDNLYLRLSTLVVKGTYSTSKISEGIEDFNAAEEEEEPIKSLAASVTFKPSIQLRMTF